MSPAIYHVFVRDEETDEECVTVFIPGEDPRSASTASHANFAEIKQAVLNNDPNVLDLFDTATAVSKRFEKLTDRISVQGGTLFFDGDPVHNTLTTQVVRFLNEDVGDWLPLVYFFDNVKQNPNEHSVEQLFDWIEAQGQDSGLSINEYGYIIGYKGVQKASDGTFQSVHAGGGIVNGEQVSGHVPNNPGDTVEMPRSKVQFDPGVGCSYGLHVGTYNYAKGWARGALLKVLVNPRDVVSVPTDCSAQKMRVCRYTVLDVIDSPETSAYTRTSAYDEDDYDDDCGCGCDDEGDYDEDEREDCGCGMGYACPTYN